jgi:hypothetical protein
LCPRLFLARCQDFGKNIVFVSAAYKPVFFQRNIDLLPVVVGCRHFFLTTLEGDSICDLSVPAFLQALTQKILRCLEPTLLRFCSTFFLILSNKEAIRLSIAKPLVETLSIRRAGSFLA